VLDKKAAANFFSANFIHIHIKIFTAIYDEKIRTKVSTSISIN